MPMKPNDVVALAQDTLLPMLAAESKRLEAVDTWLQETGSQLAIPRSASQEHRNLRDLASTPILPLVISTMAQALYADGFRSPDSGDNEAAWATWVGNDFEMRQNAVHRAALSYGLSYVTIMPGADANGPRSVMRGVSPRKMIALYADPAEDDWPMFSIKADFSGPDKRMLRLMDEECVYYLSTSLLEGDKVEYIEPRFHDSGVCPVVRYSNMLDLDGRTEGEVKPLIPLAERYNKTTYDRLLTQHFNSWKVRTATGLGDFAGDEDEAAAKKTKLSQEDMLVASHPDAKFGTLDETPLDGFIKAGESDLDTLSAVAQIPASAFQKVANLSAEAISELRAGLNQKIFERQQSFGKSDVQGLRLAHYQETGKQVSTAARMTWRDMSPRTINQVVDGLAKAVKDLGVPAEGVWHLIPGTEQADVDDWRSMTTRQGSQQALSALAEAARMARSSAPVAALETDRGNPSGR